ncbi:MAG: class I SAM-dependent methyltransferase [Treponema sp.]|nr:class I SAM-dependent methyltransferase [Candidatus Treponema caballi]
MKASFSESHLERHIPSLVSLWKQKESGAFLLDKEYKSVSSSLLSLQRGLTGKRDLIGVNYMEDKAYLGAYLLYYWPVSYLQVSYAALSVRSEIAALCEAAARESRPLRILDLGSGPGPACAAVADICLDALASCEPGDGSLVQKNCAISVTLLDQSEKSLSRARRLFERDFPGVQVTTAVCDFERGTLSSAAGFDIIVMSHALNELWKGDAGFLEKRAAFLEKCLGALTPGGFMLVCEPALLETSRSLLSVRDLMLERGYDVKAPCASCRNASGAFRCPAITAGENQTCHGEVTWTPCEPVAGIAARAGLDRESVKMSYVVLSGAPASEKTPAATRKPLREISGRVVSDGMLNKGGRIRFVICTGKERITVSAKQGDPVAKRKGFFSFRRYDTVTITNPEIRGDRNNVSYGIDAGTEIVHVPFAVT